MTYQVAETFRSVQGEGVHTGTLMQFIRFVGCSVGKSICTHCDTDFKSTYPWKGGGTFDKDQLLNLCNGVMDVCFTGGEPFNQNLDELLPHFSQHRVHIETSGTVPFTYPKLREGLRQVNDHRMKLWITVSPKPGFIEDVVMSADEVKVIVPGLGDGPGWPTIEDARRWAAYKQVVYLQPRNGRDDVNRDNLALVLATIDTNPQLRLSAQLHKYLKVR